MQNEKGLHTNKLNYRFCVFVFSVVFLHRNQKFTYYLFNCNPCIQSAVITKLQINRVLIHALKMYQIFTQL